MAEIDRLRVHVKENILCYMQAIWRSPGPASASRPIPELSAGTATAASHPLRVEEMKSWLNSGDAGFVGRAEISRRDSAGRQKTHADYAGRKGIVAFRNFWGSGNQGDHIDLWNGAQIARGDNDFFERSEELWFWPLSS